MKIGFLFILIIIISSCKARHNVDFESIDYSCYKDRSQEFFSLKIFSDGKTYVDRYNGHVYFLNLNDKEIDSISLLIKSILDSQLDSINKSSCNNCYSFNAYVKTKNRKTQIFYVGEFFSDDKYKKLDNFAKYINGLIDKPYKIIDSTLFFESYSEKFKWPYPMSLNK